MSAPRAVSLFVLALAASGCDPLVSGPPPEGPLCANTCAYAFDGECDDGGPGSLYSLCEYGTDCGDCGTRRGPAPTPPVTRRLGPEGGSVAAEGVSVSVPPGALEGEVEIVVREESVGLPAGIEARSRIFAFEPHGLTFALPVDVAFEGVSDATSDVFWSNAGGGFDRLDTIVEGGVARAQVLHFSHGFAGGASGACTCSEASECCDGCAAIAENEQCARPSPDELGVCRAGACERFGTRRTIASFSTFFNAVAISNDGTRVVSGDSHGAVRVFDADSFEELASFTTLFEAGDVAISPDNRFVAASGCHRAATTCVEGKVEVYDLASGTPILSELLPSFGGSVALHYGPSTETPIGVAVASCTPSGDRCPSLVRVYRFDGSLIHEMIAPLGGAVAQLDVHRSGGWLAIAGCDQPDARWGCTRGRARVLRTDTWASVYDDAPFTTDMLGVALLAHTSYVLMGSRGLLEPGFYFREAPTGTEHAALDVCADEIAAEGSGTAFATHCRTGGPIQDGIVRVYELRDVHTPRYVVRGSAEEIRTVALGPGGSFLVTAGQDGVLRRWDLSGR